MNFLLRAIFFAIFFKKNENNMKWCLHSTNKCSCIY